ncbi:MAG: hypothetical protein KZQ97_20950 [Candidatus Thiodiazotropha sp. (ex Dulcina madagascariensis)]|nr:hypothetical protein [Candidatus Thiodiazotropha sp. (ex Dulcina madagascariensis)]
MKIPIWGLFVIVLAVLINNLAWFYSAEEESVPDSKCLERLSGQARGDCEVTSLSFNKTIRQEIAISGSDEYPQNNMNIDTDAENTSVSEEGGLLLNQPSPVVSDNFEIDVPIEASQMYLYEHDIARDQFHAAGFEDKLNTIQSLSAQGDDLELIKEIIEIEDNATIKAAAIVKLANKHSFVATKVLIEALDDPVKEVTLTALNTIVANGDRTLVPLLHEKMIRMPDGSIRDEFEKSIRRLEFSVTMGTDEIQIE